MRPFATSLSGGDANLVEHVVIEVVLVRADARLLVRVDGERRRQILAAEALRDEGVHVGRVRRIVQRDERRIHVTGCARRCRPQQESRRSQQLQHRIRLFFISITSCSGWCHDSRPEHPQLRGKQREAKRRAPCAPNAWRRPDGHRQRRSRRREERGGRPACLRQAPASSASTLRESVRRRPAPRPARRG